MLLKVAILASGNGSNAQSIFDNMNCGKLDIEIVLVVSNRPNSRVLKRAQEANIPILELDHTLYASREEFDKAMIDALQKAQAELIVLAGYMRILSSYFLNQFKDKVINIHPAILPSFKGAHGLDDAYNSGVTLTGCTVHFVNEELDSGAIIIQAAIPILSDKPLEELEARIHKIEHKIYPQAIQWFAQKRLSIVNGKIHFIKTNTLNNKICIHNKDAYLIWPPLENSF